MRLTKPQRGFLIRAGHPTCLSTLVLGPLTKRTVRALERRGLVEVETLIEAAVLGAEAARAASLLVRLTPEGKAEAARLRASL